MEKKQEGPPAAKGDPKRRSYSGLLIAIIILLFGVSGALYWQYTEVQKELANCELNAASVESERQVVIGELNEMLVKYDTLSAGNVRLSDELMDQREKVEKLLADAKNKNWTIHKLKKETATLREIMKEYVHTIDSLNTLNINLRVENKEVRHELNDQRSAYSDLEKVREGLEDKVAVGSRLQTNSIMALAQRVKSNGVHRETMKADKTDKIKCCFTLALNHITKPGKKNVFLRIISPTAQVLSEGPENRFKFSGMEGEYSVKKQIDYQNTEQDVCMYWKVTDALPPGKYIIEVYADDADIGRATIELK